MTEQASMLTTRSRARKADTRTETRARDEARKEEHHVKNCQQAAKTLELSGCVVAEREQANKRHRSSRENTQRKKEVR